MAAEWTILNRGKKLYKMGKAIFLYLLFLCVLSFGVKGKEGVGKVEANIEGQGLLGEPQTKKLCKKLS